MRFSVIITIAFMGLATATPLGIVALQTNAMEKREPQTIGSSSSHNNGNVPGNAQGPGNSNGGHGSQPGSSHQVCGDCCNQVGEHRENHCCTTSESTCQYCYAGFTIC
ncbi:hypothetical protein TUN199_02594 [Pyrenophora tritici-repentis]|uniref:Uncharacterized protein n=1 Tax=Pyrenophora tritici-repentis TaxID=45151 RepID=A0A5M9LEN4_9PLEO|nr:hypothetical protein PtrV1_06257 [Pyrenophora tritici-repentis]KAF7450977.1 hypothetical protein A1F99_055930 [Pyrenophora tritici-repentis]KAF7573658.1 hypothetical protein PtrM4_085630 [Pyrenophora tritici-repentis]KAI0570409.1 hypothetical protein Alg215_11071 [Pyrenophora tritici-repentis]KAI0590304.1 hypothetical protein Alg130_02361 [Pyrenophora tritici-repentis]